MSVRHHTPAEVAERYGVSEYFVRQRTARKAWPHLRVGRRVMFTAAHLEQIDALLSIKVSQEAKAKQSWGRKTRGGAA